MEPLEAFYFSLGDLKGAHSNDVSEILDRLCEELTFVDLQGDSCFLKCRQHGFHMADVFLYRRGEDDDIIDIYQAGFPLVPGQYDIQRSLKGCWRIRETEGHP